MKPLFPVLLFIFLFALPAYAVAQSEGEVQAVQEHRRKGFLKRLIRSFDDYDTTYIAPNYYNYTAMMQNTHFFHTMRLRGTDEKSGESQWLQFAPRPTFKVGPYFGWRWLFLGYSFDLSQPASAGKASEFNLSLYSAALGCDLTIVRNDDNFRLKRVSGFSDEVARSVRDVPVRGLESYTAAVSAYYVLNHRHYSYPAAFSQSTVQKRSCGSWLFGFRFLRQTLDFDYTKLPAVLLTPQGESKGLIDALKVSEVDYRSYSLSVGYGYNWVIAPRLLLSASVAPSFGYCHNRGDKFHSDRLYMSFKELRFDVTGRAALVWNTGRVFAGASAVGYFFDYRRNDFAYINSVNYLYLYAGFYLDRKRQYR